MTALTKTRGHNVTARPSPSAARSELRSCPDATPSPAHIAVARDLERIARRLEPGLPKFRTRWVDGGASGRFGEMDAYGGQDIEIVLRVDLPAATVPGILAHELGHALDVARGRAQSEASAEAFAGPVIAEYHRAIATAGERRHA